MVSIPLRKFRKAGGSLRTGSKIVVSIPLRKFRKDNADAAKDKIYDCFHPSKEV